MIINAEIIYIFCPAYVKSGGPELLHQLSYQLNKRNKIVYMVYYNQNSNKECVAKDFQKYNPKVIDISQVEDNENNVVIVPETNLYILSLFKEIKKCIWWLSVDNFSTRYTFKGRIRKCGILKALHPFLYVKMKFLVNSAHLHLCQSYYAKQYLSKRGIKDDNVYMLSDYINDIFFEQKSIDKKDYVAYFPSKGFKIVKELIKESPDLCWVPIQNMTTDQVHRLLLECKVYIDFGDFPGKDRVPREAAISNCCLITGTQGASAFYEDISIPSTYKFSEPLASKNEIVAMIRRIIEDYDRMSLDFEEFRRRIRKEKNNFEEEIDFLFM